MKNLSSIWSSVSGGFKSLSDTIGQMMNEVFDPPHFPDRSIPVSKQAWDPGNWDKMNAPNADWGLINHQTFLQTRQP